MSPTPGATTHPPTPTAAGPFGPHPTSILRESDWASGPAVADRALVAAINDDVVIEIRSDGVITPRAGEPVAYLISAATAAAILAPARPASAAPGGPG